MLPNSRVCTKCGLDKPLPEFSKAPRGRYGRKSSCKACDAARHSNNYVPRQRGPRRDPLDESSFKTCTKCGATKTLVCFSLSRKATETRNAVYRSHCKECQATAARKWFAENSERANENRRRYSLFDNYGITTQDYDALLRQQGGVCAICGNGEPDAHGRTGKKFRLSVDHCHDTGAVRGLLCQKCNRAIGLLNDDPIRLRKAISYLLFHRRKAGHPGGQ